MMAWAWTAWAWAASPCDSEGGLPVGPAAVALWDGDLGRARRPCPRTEVGVAPRGLVLVDTPAFYGQIVASALVEGSIAADDRTEVWLRLEPLRFQNVISAIPSSFLGYGFTGIGVTHRIDGGDSPAAVAFLGHAVLPSAIELQGNSLPFGVNLAVTVDRPYSEHWSLHGQLGYVGSASLGRGPAQLRTGYAGTVGAVWKTGRAFAVVLDAQTAIAYAAVLDHLALAPGLRFAAGPAGFELAAAVPLAGRERTLAVIELHSTLRY